jgi:hypothetical protein
MIEIQAPGIIKRGEVLRGKAIIKFEKELNARSVSVSFDNEISYSNPCTDNLSRWSISNPGQLFDISSKPLNITIPFEFSIPKEVPPSYKGSSLTSRWKIDVKIDIPMALDIHAEMNVEVER